MPKSIGIPPGRNSIAGLPPQRYVAGTIYIPGVKKDKVESKVACLRKQHNGRGLNPGPPDPEFEVLTARPHTPKART